MLSPVAGMFAARAISCLPHRFEAAVARSERTLTFAILLAALILQMNGILHHGFMGQDWGIHPGAAAEAIQLPPPLWFVYVGTNPPGLYWLSGLVHYATGSAAYIAATSFVVVGLNLLALLVWARLATLAIRQPSLRIAALLTLAFLPFRVIHSTVFASDGLVVLPFTLVLWLSCELFQPSDDRRRVKQVVALSVAMLAGIYSKYTMASGVPVMLGLLVVLRRRFSSRPVLASALVLLVAIPGLFAVEQYHVYAHLSPAGTGRQHWAREMEWRSLFMLRAADADVLRAPQYLDQVNVGGVEIDNLLANNRHSYPALLHLSMFTDVLNIFQYDPTDSYFGSRDERHQRLMTLAVRSSLPLSLLMIAATGLYTVRARSRLRLRRLRDSPARRELPAMIVLAFSAAFFANIVLFLPFVQHAYYFGYWLARLVMPALLGFCFLGFVLLDECLRSAGARAAALAYAAAQAVLHASFLWTRGP